MFALLPLPALADVTARYSAGGKTLTIEAEDGGNARADIASKVTLIRRDGVDYVVARSAAGDARVAASMTCSRSCARRWRNPIQPSRRPKCRRHSR